MQTDAAGDDLVTLRLVQVLHEVIKSHMRVYLTDAAAWDIVESCYAVLVRGIWFWVHLLLCVVVNALLCRSLPLCSEPSSGTGLVRYCEIHIFKCDQYPFIIVDIGPALVGVSLCS